MMVIKKYIFFIFLFCITVCSCYLDSIKSIEKYIVGNISVIDSNDQAGGNYLMVFHENEGYNKIILNDYVTDLIGNDSLLLLKCLDADKCNNVFYKVNHNKGEKPIVVTKLDSSIYLSEVKFINSKYVFNTDKKRCP